MEALAAAYDSSTDDEEYRPDGEGKEEEREQRRQSEQREGKRRRMVDFGFDSKTQYHFPETVSAAAGRFATSRSNSVEEGSIQQAKSAVPVWPSGRYVPKRERAAAAAALADSTLSQSSSSVIRSPGYTILRDVLNKLLLNSMLLTLDPGAKDILSAALPDQIRRKLENIDPHATSFNRLPKGVSVIEGHKKGINAVRWSPTHASLLASAGMDHLVRIWNVWNASGQQMVQTLSSHSAAVKDIQWSIDGKCVLSCGYDKTARLTDVEYGSEIKVFSDNEQYMNVVRFHPFEEGIFLSGGSNGTLKSWDIRSGKVVKEFAKSLGQILDLDYNRDGKRFVSTSDIAKRNASDRAILVWDYDRQIPLSNQVYLEAYTCPCVRYHPFEETFIAQSNASYIAIFSGRPPFKMNRYKRFEGHQVSANRIQCNFSPDGAFVVTGSAGGSVYFYSYRSSKLLKKFDSHRQVCTDVSFHPVLPSVLASCGWDGVITLYE